MNVRIAVPLLVTIGFSLACGGGGGSSQAQALCEHLEKELECPCIAVGAGSSVVIDGLELEIDKVVGWTGKDSLPEIQNSDERARMKKVDSHTLVVEATLTNTKPVKAGVDSVFYVMNGDGDEVFNQPYNSTVYREQNPKDDWIDFWNDDDLGPGKSRPAVFVFPMKPSAVEGSMLVLRKNEKRPDPKDPRGRMKVFTDELFVMDLPTPE